MTDFSCTQNLILKKFQLIFQCIQFGFGYYFLKIQVRSYRSYEREKVPVFHPICCIKVKLDPKEKNPMKAVLEFLNQILNKNVLQNIGGTLNENYSPVNTYMASEKSIFLRPQILYILLCHNVPHEISTNNFPQIKPIFTRMSKRNYSRITFDIL